MTDQQQASSKRLKTGEDDVGQYDNFICTALNKENHPLIKDGLANEKKLLNEVKSLDESDPIYELSQK